MRKNELTLFRNVYGVDTESIMRIADKLRETHQNFPHARVELVIRDSQSEYMCDLLRQVGGEFTLQDTDTGKALYHIDLADRAYTRLPRADGETSKEFHLTDYEVLECLQYIRDRSEPSASWKQTARNIERRGGICQEFIHTIQDATVTEVSFKGGNVW